jgi:hypothetical protein
MALALRIVDPEETENRVLQPLFLHWEPVAGMPPAKTENVMTGFFPEMNDVNDPESLYQREKDAFETMLPRLMQEHPGEYVAVHDGKVEAVGLTESEVADRFFSRFGDTHVYIGYVGDTPPKTYQVSPISFR